jgi:alanine dehydrogenase
VVDDPETAVKDADIVALATHAQPVIRPEWIAPGTHVSSVGYRPPEGELPRVLAREGRLFVETREAFEPTPVGCAELSGLEPATATEIGEVLLGKAPGRVTGREITVYKAMGHVVEHIAAAELVYANARAANAGTTITL